MRTDVNGVGYHLATYGEGFPLLLLHGFTGDGTTWNPFIRCWDKHSMMIIPDIIGHGKTESPRGVNRYKIESVASDLNQLLDQMGIGEIDLLGYSMGGRLALTFSLLFPKRVRKLILESSSPGLECEEERQLRRMKDEELAKFIIDEGLNRFVDYWENIPLFSTMDKLPKSVKQSIRNQRLSNNSTGLANSLIGMGTGAQPSWWNNLTALECEVLLLTGEKDKKFCAIAEKMQQNLKNPKWIVIHNSGHAIHVEDAKKFGTIVSGFITNS